MEELLNDLLNGAEIIAGFAAAGALILTFFTFRSFNKSEETKLVESVFKDIRLLEEQKYIVEERPRDKHDEVSIPQKKKDWASLFFNTLEWLSFLINRNKIKDGENIAFFKSAILEWHKEIFLDINYIEQHQITDPKQYPEFKKLVNDLTNGRFKHLE